MDCRHLNPEIISKSLVDLIPRLVCVGDDGDTLIAQREAPPVLRAGFAQCLDQASRLPRSSASVKEEARRLLKAETSTDNVIGFGVHELVVL